MNTAATRYVRRIYRLRNNEHLIIQSFDLSIRISNCFKTAVKTVRPELTDRLVAIHSKAVKRYMRRSANLTEFHNYQFRWS